MTLLLALVRRVPAMLEQQAKRNWSRQDVAAKATSVEGKVMAIVGYGQIGREIARRARPFGIRTVAVSRTRKSDEWLDESFALSELDHVLDRADIVMLTIALTPETHHLFDRRRLAACKSGVVLINVARGGLVDQQALAAALISGEVGAAATQVLNSASGLSKQSERLKTDVARFLDTVRRLGVKPFKERVYAAPIAA